MSKKLPVAQEYGETVFLVRVERENCVRPSFFVHCKCAQI